MIIRTITTLLIFTIFISPALGQGTVSSFVEKETVFSNNTINIAATLYTPSNLDNYPAIVIVHGSGTSTRQNPWTSAYVNALIKSGIAVLYPDKRGSGQSTGDWSNSTFEELAEDVIAGVQYLKTIPNIDKSRIGIIGFSQGGHIVPIAASISKDINFAISISASTVPMMEQIMDEVEMMAVREGLDSDQIEKVENVNRKYIYSALTGTNFKDYINTLNEVKQGDLKEKDVVQGFPTDSSHISSTFINTIGDFDPIPYWKKINKPILFVYGGKDKNVMVHKSISRIEHTLGKNDYNYSILFFKNNGHALYREDLLDFIARWVIDKGVN